MRRRSSPSTAGASWPVSRNAVHGHEWVIFDLQTRRAVAFPLDTKNLRDVLLYGSVSRDNAGRFYLGGWTATDAGGQRPVVLQVSGPP